MSNEPAKQPNEPTRIALRHVYFTEDRIVPGGQQLSNIKCYPEPASNPRQYLANLIPAWNCYEIWSVNATGKTGPQYMAVAPGDRWDRQL